MNLPDPRKRTAALLSLATVFAYAEWLHGLAKTAVAREINGDSEAAQEAAECVRLLRLKLAEQTAHDGIAREHLVILLEQLFDGIGDALETVVETSEEGEG